MVGTWKVLGVPSGTIFYWSLVSWPVLTLRVKKTTYVIFMCNNKCARVNATYKFQTYKAITLFQAKLLLHNHIHPPRSIRICSLRLPRALESPTATTCRIPQLQVSSKTIYNHLPSNRPQRQNKGCIFWMIYNELLVRSRNMSICFSFSTMLLAWTAQKNRNTKECLPKKRSSLKK